MQEGTECKGKEIGPYSSTAIYGGRNNWQKKKKWYYNLFALAPVCWTGQGREEDGNLDPDAGD